MYTSFKNISDQAKIWIYQADRVMTREEAVYIKENMKEFLSQWTAHGNELFASVSIEHGLFLIIALEEKVNLASGCSIDASVHFIQEIQQKLGIDFFNRTRVVLETEGNISINSIQEVVDSIKSGKIDGQTYTFNNLILTKEQLETAWKIPITESWLKKYFKQKNTVV